MTRAEIDCTRKTKLLRTFSWRLFRTPSDRISHRIQIVRRSCSQLPARSGIFCLLVEFVYWPCGLKFGSLTINWALLGIIVKLNFPRNFAFTLLNDFVSKWIVTQSIFPFFSQGLWSRINSCYSTLFSNLKQKRTHYY